ncbi:MAG: PAS domain S-box protein, partial [Gammaproteobacteria bacterium]|nr:PAS domain S-box protein [Gammaproteobacteria bacterium]
MRERPGTPPHRVLVLSDDAPRARRLGALIAAQRLEPVIGVPAEDGRLATPDGELLAVVADERCLRGAGGDVVRALRAGDATLPVVVDTGSGFPEIATAAPSLAGIQPVHTAADAGELALVLSRVLRARLEQRVAELEEHVVRVYASSQDGLMVLDPVAGRVIKTSPAAARLLEYVPSELIRLPASEVFVDSLARLRHLAASAGESGRVYNLELHGRSKSGAAVPMRVSASALKAGSKSMLLLLLRDLRPSQRAERAQRALNESEERLHAVFDHSPVTIDLKDAEGRYLLVNRNFAGLHGQRADDIAGLRTEELYADALARRIRAHEVAVLSSGKAIEREYRLKRNSRECTYLVVKFPILDSDGNVAGVGGIGSDITERKLAEAELALSEERFQGLYDNSPDMYFTVGEDGAIISVNQFGADYLGYSKDWLIGQPIWNLIHAEDLTFVREQFLLAFENEPGESKLEFRMLRRDGSVLWVHERTRLFPRTDSAQAELRVVCRDVTDAHDLSQELSYQATHDSLTGLVNRRELEHRLARVLDTARSDSSEHALCYLDLDQFKVINDTCGHVAGDELLRQLTEVLRSQVRRRDTLARLGGDEFGVLME